MFLRDRRREFRSLPENVRADYEARWRGRAASAFYLYLDEWNKCMRNSKSSLHKQ